LQKREIFSPAFLHNRLCVFVSETGIKPEDKQENIQVDDH